MVSFYDNLYERFGTTITIEDSFNRIKYGASKTLVDKIRNGNLELKSKLPIIQYCGEFTNRCKIQYPSGYAIMDADHCENAKDVKNKVSKSKYVIAAWISPSGNGVKFLVRIPYTTGKRKYKEYYLAIIQHFKKHGISLDESTNNIDRTCYESYDPDIYVNQNKTATFFEKVSLSPKQASSKNIVISQFRSIRQIIKWWMRKYTMMEGERNNNLFVLACALSEYGSPIEDTQNLLAQYQEEGFPISEINNIIKSAYRKTQFNSKSLV